MELDIVAWLMKVTTLYEKEVMEALRNANTPTLINEVIKSVWKVPGSWHKKIQGKNTATITENDWKRIIQFAKEKCEYLAKINNKELNPEWKFDDPTGTWSF